MRVIPVQFFKTVNLDVIFVVLCIQSFVMHSFFVIFYINNTYK